MTSESALRSRVVRALAPLHARAVECRLGSGGPDVDYAHGWIELKILQEWPKKPCTVARLDHFTPQQRAWLGRRWEVGGLCWVLLQIGTAEMLLFTGQVAAAYLGSTTQRGLYSLYSWRHERPLREADVDLLRYLRSVRR